MRKQKKDMWILMVLVVLVGCLTLCSCAKKDPAAEGDAQPSSTPAADTPATAPAAAPVAGGMVALPLQLPKRMFVGTPTNIEGVTHLEKPRGEARPAFLAPVGVTNVALNKPVTSSVEEPILGELAMVTDGDKEASDQSLIEIDPFSQQVTVDLEAEHEMFAILIWHYHKQSRVYFDVIVQVSNDPDFIEGVTTIFNNDIDNSSGLGVGEDMHYVETNEGKLIDAKGIKGRYVRLYSMGSNASDVNHYLEVEVYGRPAQ